MAVSIREGARRTNSALYNNNNEQTATVLVAGKEELWITMPRVELKEEGLGPPRNQGLEETEF